MKMILMIILSIPIFLFAQEEKKEEYLYTSKLNNIDTVIQIGKLTIEQIKGAKFIEVAEDDSCKVYSFEMTIIPYRKPAMIIKNQSAYFSPQAKQSISKIENKSKVFFTKIYGVCPGKVRIKLKPITIEIQ